MNTKRYDYVCNRKCSPFVRGSQHCDARQAIRTRRAATRGVSPKTADDNAMRQPCTGSATTAARFTSARWSCKSFRETRKLYAARRIVQHAIKHDELLKVRVAAIAFENALRGLAPRPQEVQFNYSKKNNNAS